MSITDKIDLEEIVDDYRYASMAFLVDKEEVIKEIRKARKFLELTRPMRDDDVMKWLSYKYKTTSIPRMNEEDRRHSKQDFYITNVAESLKIKFRKDFNYRYPIKYAILSGKITDKEFGSEIICEPYPFPHGFEELELFLEEPVIAIFVGPKTKYKDVESLMKNKIKKMFRKMKENTKISKESRNIRRDRKWFWLKRLGMSYQQIADLEEVKLEKMRNVVIKAIKQYEKNLAVEK